MKRFPLITAHSGCMGMPDNTLMSLAAALAAGADIVEDDIRMTRDGTLVLAHDDELYTRHGTAHSISGSTIKELGQLDFADRFRSADDTGGIATLESALPLLRSSGKTMNLDIKADECLRPAAELIEREGLGDRVFLSGCEYERALHADRLAPKLRKLLNADSRLFADLPYDEAVLRTCEDALAASCFGLNVNYRLLRPALLEKAAVMELPVYVWTIDNESEMQSAVRMGVHSITTRNVSTLVRLKAEWLQREGDGLWDIP